ncbi:MAG: PD-(D/E)XK nuclease family protein [Candidatus Hydrothermales bacterium]
MSFEVKVYLYKSPNNLLERVCEEILSFGKDFSRVAVIFPNKRPAYYLRKILYEKLKASFILPSIFSFEEFAFKILSEKEHVTFINSLDATYILKKILDKKGVRVFGDTFREFFAWGLKILKAINELIMNDVDFSKLKILKDYTEIKDEMKGFFDVLDGVKDEYYEELYKRRKIDKALLFKRLKEINFELPYEKIIFAGFYALLPLEEHFILKILKSYPSKIFFLITRESEAIYDFVRRNNLLSVTVESEPKENNFYFIRVKDFYSQSIFIREKLKEIGDLGEKSEIGIIVPNPSRLDVILGEICTDLKTEFNVTMGYPFKLTPFFSFLKNYFEAKLSVKEDRIYYNSLLNLLYHPFLISFFHEDVQNLEEKLKDLNREKGKIFFSYYDIFDSRLSKPFLSIIRKLFTKIHTLREFIEEFSEIISLLFSKVESDENVLSRIILGETYALIDSLRELEIVDERLGMDSIKEIVLFYLEDYEIPLTGDPLKGIQILGVLEARLIPFKHVFFLDLIEGIYPKSYKYDPLLPESLRKILGLPSYKEYESIYSYYFYQITENTPYVYLIFYSSEGDEDFTESRFLQRLLWEKEKKEKRVLYDEIPTFTYSILLKKEKRKIVEKCEKIMELLYKKAEEGFSVTEIDEYINCPFRFYELSVIGNREPEDIKEDIESKAFGVFLHELVESFYRENFLSEKIEWNSRLKKLFLEFFSQKFDERFGKEREILWLRKSYLKFKAEKFIDKIAIKDSGILEFLELRVDFEKELRNFKVKIKGVIDRVDKVKDFYRIIDYKISKSYFGRPRTIKSLTRREIRENLRSMQVPLYALMISKALGLDVREGAYYIFATGDVIDFKIEQKENETGVLSIYKIDEILGSILNEIYDESIPFEPDSKSFLCRSCPYKAICGEY